jgi:hypothetical protein
MATRKTWYVELSGGLATTYTVLEGWERIFGPYLAYGLEQGREEFKARNRPLNPNDADEHPEAD